MSNVPSVPSPPPSPPSPAPAPATPWWMDYRNVTNLIQLLMQAALWAWILTHPGAQPPPPLPTPIEPVLVQTGGRGWVNDPEAVSAAIPQIAKAQGMPAEFAQVARGLLESEDDNHSTFLWEAEQKVLKTILPSWDQGPIGTCVSFGFGRGAQDLMLIRTAAGEDHEMWPGHQVATEPIYGGSRVEIGHGRIRGDGSVGAWALQWCQSYGLLFRQKYDGIDLSTYSTDLSRQWGKTGVPRALETVAKDHPITTAARVGTGSELWAALGSAYPVPVCSDYGFEGPVPSDGVFSRRGTWGHCMLFRGRFMHPSHGKCVIVQNSWGNYLGKRITVATADKGDVLLPEGCFAITLSTADKMVKEGDTFALSGLKGFPKRQIDWGITRSQPRRDPLHLVFALAP